MRVRITLYVLGCLFAAVCFATYGCRLGIPGVDQHETDTRGHAVGQASVTNSTP